MSHALDCLYAPLSVALGVHYYPLCERTVLIDGDIQQVLNSIDSLALLPDKESGFFRSHVHSDHISCIIGIYGSIEAHSLAQRDNELINSEHEIFWCIFSN